MFFFVCSETCRTRGWCVLEADGVGCIWCRGFRQWQHTTSKPAIPQLDARFHKCPLQTHVSGMTDSTSKAAIPHLDARFHVEPSDRSQIEVVVCKRFPACGRSSMGISTQRCEIKRPLVHDDYVSKHVLNPHATATRPDFLASLPPMAAATHKNKGRLPHVGVRFHKVTLRT